MAKTICGYSDMKVKMSFFMKDKQLVSYKDLVTAMNEYRDVGDPSFVKEQDAQTKKSLVISKLLGLFITLSVITSQRSSTVREVKFEDFREE